MDYVDNPMPQVVVPPGMVKGEKGEFEMLKKVVGNVSEDNFIPVSEMFGNMLAIPVEDFPELAEEARGSEVMLIVRGAIKGKSDIGGGKPMLELYIWDAAKVHGECKKKNYDGMKQALMPKETRRMK
jgi:hypothetical protein